MKSKVQKRNRNIYYFLLWLRVGFSLLIFVFPIISATLVTIVDYIDGYFAERSGIKTRRYQLLDKLLDFVWYAISLVFVITNIQNQDIVRLLIGLFIYRLFGDILFALTNKSILLVIFGNYYENILFFVLFFTFIPVFSVLQNPPYVYVVMILVSILKLIQEIMVHYTHFPFAEKMWGIKMHWKK